MALTPSSERKSLRRTMKNESGMQVLAMTLSYESRETVLQVERIDTAYCDEHADDVQQAVSSFLDGGNAALALENLPRIE